MDKLILGLLVLQRLTVYELRAIIRKNFQSMCSDSLGGIQSAVKKLLEAGLVTVMEYVEKGVNKRQYSITDKGRAEFLEWIQIPADISNSKNMELGKLMFMGMLPVETRTPLIEDIIDLLEGHLADLLEIQANVNIEAEKIFDSWKTDVDYFAEVAKRTKAIGAFNELSMQYCIDTAKFNLEWFRKLKEKNPSI